MLETRTIEYRNKKTKEYIKLDSCSAYEYIKHIGGRLGGRLGMIGQTTKSTRATNHLRDVYNADPVEGFPKKFYYPLHILEEVYGHAELS